MASMIFAALYWLTLHLVIAGPARPALARRLGERGFRGVFSVLSAVGLAWLILAFRAAPAVPLWPPVPGAPIVALALVLLAFLLLALSIATDNPTLVGAEKLLKQRLPVRGVTRITRYPMLWAFALWAVAHLLANGDAAGALLFGAILVTALNGMVSIDRKRREALGPAWDAFAQATSRVPFAAIAAGRNTLRLDELSIWRIALGIALFAVALWLHGRAGLPPLG